MTGEGTTGDDHPEDENRSERVTRTVRERSGDAVVVVPAAWLDEEVVVTRLDPSAVSFDDYTVEPVGEFAALATDGPAGASSERRETVYAGPDVYEVLRVRARDPAVFAVGFEVLGNEFAHGTVPRTAFEKGLLALGEPGSGKTSLFATLAWQAIEGGAGAAVFSRTDLAPLVARALTADRARDLDVVGGTAGCSVNVVDVGLSADEGGFLDAVDAVTDGLTSLLTVLAPQLRDCVREFVMTAKMAGEPTTLADLDELVRYGTDGAAASIPDWVETRSHDLLHRVDAVDDEAIGAFRESLAPYLAEPVHSLVSDPDPDGTLVDVVSGRRPLAVHLPAATYDSRTYNRTCLALVHCLWGLAREFVPADADQPFSLFGDEFGSVLAAADDLDRLYARLHRTNVTAAFALESPEDVDEETWTYLAENVGSFALFSQVPDATDRLMAFVDVDAVPLEAIESLQVRIVQQDTFRSAREFQVYAPPPPRTPDVHLAWTS